MGRNSDFGWRFVQGMCTILSCSMVSREEFMSLEVLEKVILWSILDGFQIVHLFHLQFEDVLPSFALAKKEFLIILNRMLAFSDMISRFRIKRGKWQILCINGDSFKLERWANCNDPSPHH